MGMIEWRQKPKTEKNPLGFQQNPQKIPGPKTNPQKIPCRISEPQKFPQSINWNNMKNTPNNPYLNQATQKILAKFSHPKKVPELKISNPKKSFDHPHHLKFRVPPWHFLFPANLQINLFQPDLPTSLGGFVFLHVNPQYT